MEWLWKRVNEPSSWAGLSSALAIVGTSLGSGSTLYTALAMSALSFVIKEKGDK
jgi:hypothetical protein